MQTKGFKTFGIIIIMIMLMALQVGASSNWKGPAVGIYQEGNSVQLRFYNPNENVGMEMYGIVAIRGEKEGIETVLINFTVPPKKEFVQSQELPIWAASAELKMEYKVDGKYGGVVYLSRLLNMSSVTPRPSVEQPEPILEPVKTIKSVPGFETVIGIIAITIVLRRAKKGKCDEFSLLEGI